MQVNEVSLATRGLDQVYSDRLRPTAIARRVLQGVGGGACVLLAAAMPWADFSRQGITLGSVSLSMPVVIAIALTVAVGLAFFAASVWGLVRRLPWPTRFGVLLISIATVLSLAGLEYGYLRHDGLVVYEYRTAVRLLGYALGIALLACTVPEELGPRLAVLIRSRELNWRHVLALAALATSSGAVMGAVVLQGMPHIIDGTSYLLQGRTLWSGRLAIDPPMFPELFAGELVHFRTTAAGYFSKYPVGWPAVLGLFDTLGVPWLANALLSGVLVVLTYAVVAEQGSKRLAGVAAFAAAICPWLWMNAATMMPHLASSVWLWLFLLMFLKLTHSRSRLHAWIAGLALGFAVLTRPADAAFFALPCIVTAIAWMAQRPGTWLPRMPIVALAALPGTGTYLVINQHLAGSGNSSTYGDSHGGMLLRQMPDSLPHALAWLHEGWVGVNTAWFAGAVPVAMLVLCGLVFGKHYLRGHRLAMMCSLSLLLCYTVFVFGGRAWVGPRWYVPLIPAAAILIAAGLRAASHTGRVRSPGGVLAAGYLRAVLVAGFVVFLVALPARVIELADKPPHGIDATLVQINNELGLSNAVVAMPVDGLDPDTLMPNYKRGIAAMWSMQVPFERSDVIYISAVEGWQQMAEQAWPDRHLLEVSSKAGDWTITEVVNRDPSPANSTNGRLTEHNTPTPSP